MIFSHGSKYMLWVKIKSRIGYKRSLTITLFFLCNNLIKNVCCLRKMHSSYIFLSCIFFWLREVTYRLWDDLEEWGFWAKLKQYLLRSYIKPSIRCFMLKNIERKPRLLPAPLHIRLKHGQGKTPRTGKDKLRRKILGLEEWPSVCSKTSVTPSASQWAPPKSPFPSSS